MFGAATRLDSGTGEAGVEGDAVAARAVPHSSQNFCPGRTLAPHVGHVKVSALPHSTQNFAAGWFSVPQRAQTTVAE